MSAIDPHARPTPLFRPQAVQHHANPGQDGHVLYQSSRWSAWCFWLVVVTVVSTLVYAALGTVHEYASGAAVVRVEDRTDVTALVAGTVASVDVRPGQHVAAGDALFHLSAADESAELAHLDQEFELALIRYMRDRSDQAARSSLSSLRAQKDLAAARLDQRVVRATRAGVVSDVRARQGQHLSVGELVLSIVGDDAPVSLIAVLPGQYRPQLRVGMPLRFEVDGYRYQYQELTVESISDDVVGPAEVRRYLGPDLADVVPLNGPLVLVRARLPGRTFVADDQRYTFFDGLPGHADVRLRSVPIIMALIPALRGLHRHGR